MKPTRKQRNEVYVESTNHICDSVGLCYCISKASCVNQDDLKYSDYPELMSFLPFKKHKVSHWHFWPLGLEESHDERLLALAFMIAMTE